MLFCLVTTYNFPSGLKRYQCDRCSYKAATSSNLKRHYAIHMNIRQFLCAVCNMTFRQKIHLDRHTRYKHEVRKLQIYCKNHPLISLRFVLVLDTKTKGSGETPKNKNGNFCQVRFLSKKRTRQNGGQRLSLLSFSDEADKV